MSSKNKITLIKENINTVREFRYSVVLKQNKDADGVGIAAFVKSMTLFSSLEDMSMSMELTLSDSINLIDDNYLQVGSIIEVTIKKTEDDPAEKIISALRFYITNIDGQLQSTSGKQKGYDIAAYTFAAIANEWPLLEKMKEETPSELIKKIAVRLIEKDQPERLGKEEYGDWIDTDNRIENGIFFHQVKPFQAIAQLLRKSIAGSGNGIDAPGSAFYFFEDYQGFKLKSLRSMASEENKEKAWKYTFYPEKNNTDTDSSAEKDYFRVLYLAQYNHTDYFELMRSGILRSELVFIDLVNKEAKTQGDAFKYGADTLPDLQKNVFLLGDNFPIDTSASIYGEEALNPAGLDYDFTPTTHIAISNNAWDRSDYLQKYISTRIQKKLLKQTQITIEVYGNQAIKPGDILRLDVPAKSTVGDDKKTRRQCGDFIVWAVKHNIKDNIFQTIVDLCKDTYEEDVTKQPNDNSVNT